MNGEQYSDQQGVVRFGHVLPGAAKVFVDGCLVLRVAVGVEEHTDVTVTMRE